jgi:hypothetical protein
VTGEALIRQDRTHIAIKGNLIGEAEIESEDPEYGNDQQESH